MNRFATIRPLIYIDHDSVDRYLKFLTSNPDETLTVLAAFASQISHGVFSLIRPAPSWENDDTLSLRNPQDIADFDSLWHPEYQRYSEHILNHLIQIPLGVLGMRKGKNYTSQTLGNRADLLRKFGYGHLVKGFDRMVRNAISHGTITYGVASIGYLDKTEMNELAPSEFSELYDDLVTTCNSTVCGLLLFLAEMKDRATAFGLSKLPLGLRFLLVDGLVSHGGFRPLMMIESQLSQTRKQLNLVCEIDSEARSIQLMEALSLCINCHNLGGDEYGRYFISMQCGPVVPASLAIDGDRLKDVVQSNKPVEDIDPGLFEATLLWFDASQINRRIYLWGNLLKAKWRDALQVFRAEMDRAGYPLVSTQYEIRHIENNSSERDPRVMAHLLLNVQGQVPDNDVLKICQHAVGRLRNHRVRTIHERGERGIPSKPKYIGIRMYSNDNTLRRLKAYSWATPQLLVVAEWIYSERVMDYFYTKDPDLSRGRTRVKFNPKVVSRG